MRLWSAITANICPNGGELWLHIKILQKSLLRLWLLQSVCAWLQWLLLSRLLRRLAAPALRWNMSPGYLARMKL